MANESALKFNEKISQNSNEVYSADGGGIDAYAITLTPTLTAYATGQVFNFSANTANTGAASLNVDLIGPIDIKKKNNDDLDDDDIEAGQIITVIYDGTYFQMQTPPAAVPAGRIIQVVSTQTGASSTGTTIITGDDSIPQITEGDEYMTLAVTPTSVTNNLKIDVIAIASSNLDNMWMTAALFQDATANALAATVCTAVGGGGAAKLVTLPFTHIMAAGTTSSTTFRVRVGPGSAATVTFNGNAASRSLGGVLASSIVITEIEV